MKRIIKKVIAAVLSAAVILTMSPAVLTAGAAEKSSKPKVWSGKSDTSWFDGKKDSYDIKNAEQLAGLAEIVNKGTDLAGITFNLTSDIYLNSEKDIDNFANWLDIQTKKNDVVPKNPPKNVWTPIGYSKSTTLRPFNGIFNGNGHTIKGMYAVGSKTTGSRAVGLFGYIYCAGISSVKLDHCVVYGNSSDTVYAGGIAGISEGSVINKCCADYTVVCARTSDWYGLHEDAAGGIVGFAGTENVNGILAALAVEAILGAGGLIANPALFNDGTSPIKESGIYNCMSYCNVFAIGELDTCAGGIIGDGQQGLVKNCFSDCNGLYSKHVKYDGTNKKGFIAGQVFRCPLVNCYAYNRRKYTNVGGIGVIDYALDVKITDNVVMVSRDALKKKSNIKKFGDAYTYDEQKQYPVLKCFA